MCHSPKVEYWVENQFFTFTQCLKLTTGRNFVLNLGNHSFENSDFTLFFGEALYPVSKIYNYAVPFFLSLAETQLKKKRKFFRFLDN